MKTISQWNDIWGRNKPSETEKQMVRESFIRDVWDREDFYLPSAEDAYLVVPVGLLNLDVSENGKVYEMWRRHCQNQRDKG